jgi:cellulose synthase/poly-beta-1,6-N-acetylglucosamine synthase-like glycosyltransferase
VLIAVLLFAQATWSTLLLLHVWDHPRPSESPGRPEHDLPPASKFTLLIPARHEERVIAQTIRQVLKTNYPADLLEVIVICEAGDTGTIACAREAIAEAGATNAFVATFDDGPINKPHGLNVGLARATGDIIGVFDAEDDVHPDMLTAVNTIFHVDYADVVQGPVQLMNHEARWYAALNCVEYYLWFNSRLHHDARTGVMPLGGNTIFVRRYLLDRINGWDDHCLTEDADLGFRLSAAGARFRVFSSPELATREEVPPTIGAFIRQRARWHQGFLQVVKRRAWRHLPTWRMRFLAFNTLTQPFTTSLMALFWPLAVAAVFVVNFPVVVALLTFLPLYALITNLIVNLATYWQFGRDFNVHIGWKHIVRMAIAFIPYSLLLGAAAVRGLWRETTGQHGWDKTTHLGGHRTAALGAAAPAEVLAAEAKRGELS